MALMPKRIKHRKQMRGKNRGNATRGNTVSFGEFGVQATQAGWITARQIEAGRMTATHFLHREGRVYIRIFPDKPVSAKPLETRMGKGKGETADWVAVVKPGTILFEIGDVDEVTAKSALRRVASKMPLRCRMAYRRRTI
ncbi:MAG: 50S ribosomal protein L16 [Planctomycetes bacterium]|nr:50S ribosomal protein L16 [Planctomycetota bacterium]